MLPWRSHVAFAPVQHGARHPIAACNTIFFSFFWGISNFADARSRPVKVRVRRPGGDIFKSMLWWTWKCPKKEKGRMLRVGLGSLPRLALGKWNPYQKWMVCYRKIPWFWEVPQNLGGKMMLMERAHGNVRRFDAWNLKTCIQDGYGSSHLKQIMTVIPIYRPREKVN